MGRVSKSVWAIGLVVIGGVVVSLVTWLWSPPSKAPSSSVKVEDEKLGKDDFVLPELNALERMGARLFSENCSRCHGENALGTDRGPPLLHDIYNPGHHPDESFYRAVQFGVRQHHWKFGDMPALRDRVQPHQVRAIIAYIRKLQHANGIVFRPHRMQR